MKAPIKFFQLLPKALILSLLALLAIGCGDSSDDFVVQNSQSNNGNLVFQFVRPQALNVPTATTTVRFDFYRANDVLDFTSEQPFAPTITFNDVSTSIVRVVVTSLDANGFPIQDVRNDIANRHVLTGGKVERAVKVDVPPRQIVAQRAVKDDFVVSCGQKRIGERLAKAQNAVCRVNNVFCCGNIELCHV